MSIMKQQDTHIPYWDRKLDELCQDINLRAEKVFLKQSKYLLLFAVVFILGLLALGRYFQWFEINWHRDLIWLVCLVWLFVVYLVNQLLINRMKRAISPKQHLRLAKCLKWLDKLSRAFISAIVIPWPLLSSWNDTASVSTIILCVCPLLVLCFLIAPVDSDFSEALDELEYRLEE